MSEVTGAVRFPKLLSSSITPNTKQHKDAGSLAVAHHRTAAQPPFLRQSLVRKWGSEMLRIAFR
jgi:hypothetical protein